MKKVYRYQNNEEYWNQRWRDVGVDADRFERLDIYPIKYAEMVMEKGKLAVEIGCGPGRVLKHYARKGFDICGIERSPVAVENIKSQSQDFQVQVGDVLNLPYEDQSFDIVMAFGLYHNLENGLEDALTETRRIMRTGARFCISMRPDNIEMTLNEVYWRRKNKGKHASEKQFHKLLVKEGEFKDLLQSHGMKTEAVYRSRNMPFLYRFGFLRDSSEVSEDMKRSKGYRLNVVGRFIDRILVTLFPYHTANVLIFIGRAV